MTNEELVMKIKAGGPKVSCDVATEGSFMEIAKIQKMIMIPEERYDRMMESYDEAVNELIEIRRMLQGRASAERVEINKLLDEMGEEELKKARVLLVGLAGGVR